MADIRKCFDILGINPGSSEKEIKEAVRDLVKVWHPDRFANEPRLHEKAQEKLKEINEAYETIKSYMPILRTAPFFPGDVSEAASSGSGGTKAQDESSDDLLEKLKRKKGEELSESDIEIVKQALIMMLKEKRGRK